MGRKKVNLQLCSISVKVSKHDLSAVENPASYIAELTVANNTFLLAEEPVPVKSTVAISVA